MATSLTEFGNQLYTGERSIDFVARRKVWFIAALAIIAICVLGTLLRGGFEFGIEFRGGSEFRITGIEDVDQGAASDAVEEVLGQTDAHVTSVGSDGIRIQTDEVSEEDAQAIRGALAEAYDVDASEVTYSYVGPSWGADVTRQALTGLVIFIALAMVVMALYFRTWKMALAAIASLVFDLLVTAGIYGIVGFEVTPAATIGFLTILGYSLYDTVVVFDKVRENTAPGTSGSYADNINLAVNQTLVRSINTSVVAALPVASILFIGALLLGAGTLRDISLALLIGIVVGTASTLFVAAPLYAQLRAGEEIREATTKRKVERGAVV